ncbi:hypothetical protein K438DRAFT_1990013 [Mycena galopus ATCC 62051]|nr:hypothetical protein K438DRAFT_1990013 [Mycena galopus ATCC 62051]
MAPPINAPTVRLSIFHVTLPLALSSFPSLPSINDVSTPTTSSGPALDSPLLANGPTPTRAPARPVPATHLPAPTPAHTPAPTRSPTPESPLTDYNYEGADIIKRPPHAGVSHVVAIFALAYSEIDQQGREQEYTRFRDRLDQLTTIHLDSSVALVYQDKADMKAVHDAMSKDFVWLERCPQNWPISVCLQVKLHNLARNATNKSNKKVIAMYPRCATLSLITSSSFVVPPTMPSTCKHFVPGPRALFNGVYVRLYSTRRNTGSFTLMATTFSSHHKKARRYPLVESLFQEHKAQPYIHDFHVTLYHGEREDHYQVYLKRGIVLAANLCAPALKGDIIFMRVSPDNLDRVLNIGCTDKANARRDKPIVDYLFTCLCPFIKRFQKSGYLPKKGAVVHRDLAFY